MFLKIVLKFATCYTLNFNLTVAFFLFSNPPKLDKMQKFNTEKYSTVLGDKQDLTEFTVLF